MSCDAYANKDGVFELKIYGYTNGKEVGRIRIEKLDLNEELLIDVTEGDRR